tara:strand:- start:2381 stop:2668 length:288 start_codon:yes stop_codon:yes gene_type:complete
MLIEKPYAKNDTITFRTSAGEEIVARFVEENDKTLTVTKPMALMSKDGGFGLGPWLLTADPGQNISVNKNVIQFVVKTQSDMSSQYVQATTGVTI